MSGSCLGHHEHAAPAPPSPRPERLVWLIPMTVLYRMRIFIKV